VSPDGSRLATVQRFREGASRLVVLATALDSQAEKKWQERVAKTLATDPQDAAPVRSRPLSRKPVHELITTNGAEPSSVRFMPDGASLLYVRFEPDTRGFLHPDLFRWRFEQGSVERITRQGDVRAPDPAPDGTWAVVVRTRHGATQLARVDLRDGSVKAITEPDLDSVVTAPRLSPDGLRLGYLRHLDGGWRLVVRELSSGRERVLPLTGGTSVGFPAWSRDGSSLLMSLGHNGLLDIAVAPADGSAPPALVTVSSAACLAPAPSGDGKAVFFLSLEPDGLDLRLVDLASAPGVQVAGDSLAPALRPAQPPLPARLRLADVAPGRPYGIGRQELRLLVGGEVASSGSSGELGLRTGDIVGRLSGLVLGAVGRNGGESGAMAAVAWRGWPANLDATLFTSRERPSKQAHSSITAGRDLGVDRTGFDLAATWQRVWRAARLVARGGVVTARLDPRDGERFDQHACFVAVGLRRAPSRRPWQLLEELDVRGVAGRSDGDSWRRITARATLGVSVKDTSLAVSWQRSAVRGTPSLLDQISLGGLPGSVLPEDARDNRVTAPALPAAILIGDDHEGQRVELTLGGLPLFFERHRVWGRGTDRGPWLRLAGLEVDVSSDPIPLVKLPGFHVSVGAARILDEPLKGKTRAWLGLAWRQ
jgi:Tol biopolymer transport system component